MKSQHKIYLYETAIFLPWVLVSLSEINNILLLICLFTISVIAFGKFEEGLSKGKFGILEPFWKHIGRKIKRKK